MPVSVTVRSSGFDKLGKKLAKIPPGKGGREWSRRALHTCAELVQANAAEKQIIRGGRFRGPAGPRGGKGKMRDRPPHPSKLTSRTGRLRASIRINTAPLPRAIDIGTDVIYGAVHEEGLGRYPKRAFLEPALEAMSPKFSGIFARELARELAKS